MCPVGSTVRPRIAPDGFPDACPVVVNVLVDVIVVTAPGVVVGSCLSSVHSSTVMAVLVTDDGDTVVSSGQITSMPSSVGDGTGVVLLVSLGSGVGLVVVVPEWLGFLIPPIVVRSEVVEVPETLVRSAVGMVWLVGGVGSWGAPETPGVGVLWAVKVVVGAAPVVEAGSSLVSSTTPPKSAVPNCRSKGICSPVVKHKPRLATAEAK